VTQEEFREATYPRRRARARRLPRRDRPFRGRLYPGYDPAGGDLPGFTRRLVSGPDSGLGNLTARAGTPFDSLMAGWMVAMYADGLGISGLAARYTFQSWNFRDVEAALSGSYPLQVRALGSGADLTAAAYPGSGNYFRLLSTPTTPAAVFRLVSTGGGLVTFPGARLYIVRTQ